MRPAKARHTLLATLLAGAVAIPLGSWTTAGSAAADEPPEKASVEAEKQPLAPGKGKIDSFVMLIDGKPATPPDMGEGLPTCASLEVSSVLLGPLFADSFESGTTAAWGSLLPSFSARQLTDLRITVGIESGFGGQHELHVRSKTPKGHHYQTLTAAIAGTTASLGTTRRVDGFPRPMPVRAPAKADQDLLVELILPIAGTPVHNRALFGEWSVEAYLGHATEPCLPPLQFLLSR